MKRAARWGGLVALLLLAACSQSDLPVAAQTRGVDAFHSIDLRGAGTLDVLVGPAQSLVVEAGPRTRARVSTTVINGTLIIEMGAKGFWNPAAPPLALRITMPRLNSLALNGTGRISVAGLSGGATTMVIAGAGEMEASGAVDTLIARVNGTGSADLSHLQAREADVTVNGAGTLDVNASQYLTATLNGVGAIHYLGQPTQLTTSINGVGSISRR